MKSLTARAIALGTAVSLLAGCSAMPSVTPVEQRAQEALLVGEPFVFQTNGEPINATDGISEELSLDEALKLCLKHNAEIQAALARVRIAEADARQTRLLPNPVFGISYQFASGGAPSVINASVSSDLLLLLTRPGRISASDNRLRKSSAEALKVVLDSSVELQRQYADAQALDALVKIGDTRRSILKGLLDITNARLRAGEAARLDVLTAQGALSTLDSELVTLKAQQRLARLTLARLIGQPSANATWKLSPWSAQSAPTLGEDEWIQLALENRPEIESIRWELAALGQDVRLARTNALFNGGEIGANAERDGIWSVGPSLSIPIPIFDTGSVAKQRVEAQITEQRHELTQASRVVVEEVRRARETLLAAHEGLSRVQSELLPLQEQRLTQAQGAYRAGLTDILALRLAEQELQQARARVIDLQQQVSRARFELDRAVGGSGVLVKKRALNT